ncbi:transcriptional regulator AsnC [Pleionea sp. CnH1-48]|uniref:transcriptional regulator AsnC n=1 Tax=Pleionea sp. CnH1-48 TaxID=2954494 RepID=UPI0020972E21|nr:transcriptional regulator AsnC [Pleionea sp. CnH1-48]MCO7224571.1 transcriptional regulator AsnC [Pleionea sp. CnH1-48]
MENYQIDSLDKKILNALVDNARTPYSELAKQFNVSPATIHVRIEKMKNAKLIHGTRLEVDLKALGYDVCCFIGINLVNAGDYPDVLRQLQQIDEVVEAYYTTGKYSVFIKIMTHSIEELQWLLIDKIQSIDKVQATETLISLQNPIKRGIQL